jgi:hypothetical protein
VNRRQALRLLKNGPEGVADWNRRRESGENIPVLERADLSGARLKDARLKDADLSDANLSDADLHAAHLSGADLDGVTLSRTILSDTNLVGAKLGGAVFYSTVIANVNLSEAKGLESARHQRNSTLGIDTIFRSDGRIPEAFLRGCGVPDSLIQSLPSILNAMEPIQFYSCFVSHSSADKEFARRLFGRMRDKGLRVWLDDEHMKGGRELHLQIDEAIRLHDKLLLVLSDASMKSAWVATEIRRTRAAEKQEGRRKLFPLRLTEFEKIKAWQLPDSSGEDLAEEVRKFYVPNFANWKDHDSFEKAFARLINDLRAEDSTGEKPG